MSQRALTARILWLLARLLLALGLVLWLGKAGVCLVALCVAVNWLVNGLMGMGRFK